MHMVEGNGLVLGLLDERRMAMTTIAETIHAFIEETEWHYEGPEDDHIVALVPGEHGQWKLHVSWHGDERTFICRSVVAFDVPADRIAVAAEYITRANYGLTVGNFEMDCDDGTVLLRTSIPLGEDELSRAMVKRLIYGNCSLLDRYLPGLMAVAFGDVPPREAIRRIEDDEDSEDEPDADEEESHQSCGGRLASRLPPINLN